MGDFFKAILDFLRELWPLRICLSYEGAVQWWLGKNPKRRGPGIYFVVPFLSKFESMSVVPDVLRLHVQNITTADGVCLAIEVNLEYEINDVVAAFCNVHDVTDNIGDACRRHIAKRIREWKWDDLVERQKDLEKSCRGTLETRVKEWGIGVRDVGITTFCKTRNITLSNL